jgi:hypothetical protein
MADIILPAVLGNFRLPVQTRMRLAAQELGLDPDVAMAMTAVQYAMAIGARCQLRDSQRIIRTVQARRAVRA